MNQPWHELLEWWFGPSTIAVEAAGARSKLWFGKRDSQDAEARERFGGWVEQALAGQLLEWREHPEGWLALTLLLDQLPRMIYRDDPRGYSGDALAQQYVQAGVAQGLDLQLAPIQRVFIYLVLEHAEDLRLQDQAVAAFVGLFDQAPQAEQALFADYLDYAERHHRIIARFQRFPHRNKVLGRPSTEQEQLFLQEPGSGF
ncbi:DUF924 family protein [Pseudomonas segetis]|uniref:Uncharacterized conserved protein, DUF924 family n=1 Tax=Pseudomonas segetis TaxID=298908 RepID=A0A239DS72_9PSED|nr:DUF924 family protein [Pseudomonas segetis]SNS34971.1 Uncharacterized conserved protein, DUF924 family [Pseudomonas segetis]